MADKNFGVKQINIIGGSGTPTITSPNILNLNAPTVAISTDLSVGGEIVSDLIIGAGYSVGIGSTLPTSALEVGAVGSATTSLTVNGYASINGANVITWPDATDTRQSIYIGQGSGTTLIGGYYNVALGTRALEECGLGDNSNIAIGYEALRYGGGAANVVIGANAADSSSFSGTANVVIGKDAGTAMTSAFSNTLIGYAAGDSITTGDYNIFIGRDSGASITTGNRNVIIGGYDGTGAVANSEFPGFYEGSLNLADSTANIVIADGYGTVKMYINPEGNVGIATTNPTSKLTVHGGDISVGISTAHGVVLTSPNGTQYRLIVDDSGNLSTVAV
jgi:hypothetical protein